MVCLTELRLLGVSGPVAIFSRRFGTAGGTVLEVQALGLSGITDITVTGVQMNLTATEPKRSAVVTLDIDGDDFEIDLEFTDESFFSVGITGQKIEAPAPL